MEPHQVGHGQAAGSGGGDRAAVVRVKRGGPAAPPCWRPSPGGGAARGAPSEPSVGGPSAARGAATARDDVGKAQLVRALSRRSRSRKASQASSGPNP